MYQAKTKDKKSEAIQYGPKTPARLSLRRSKFWKPEKKKRALFEYPDRTRGPRDDASRKAKGKKNNNATTRAKEENTAALPRFWREKKERRRLKHSRESDMF